MLRVSVSCTPLISRIIVTVPRSRTTTMMTATTTTTAMTSNVSTTRRIRAQCFQDRTEYIVVFFPFSAMLGVRIYDETDRVNDAVSSSLLARLHVSVSPILPPSLTLVLAWTSLSRRFARHQVRSIFSARARSTSGRQAGRPERGDSVKRDWCCPGGDSRVCDSGTKSAGRQGMAIPADPPLHSREAPRTRCYSCARCIWTMFVPFGSRALPSSWAPSVYSRSSATHPAGVIIPLTPRPPDLSRCPLLPPSP